MQKIKVTIIVQTQHDNAEPEQLQEMVCSVVEECLDKGDSIVEVYSEKVK